jgi:hypothetical protein
LHVSGLYRSSELLAAAGFIAGLAFGTLILVLDLVLG